MGIGSIVFGSIFDRNFTRSSFYFDQILGSDCVRAARRARGPDTCLLQRRLLLKEYGSSALDKRPIGPLCHSILFRRIRRKSPSLNSLALQIIFKRMIFTSSVAMENFDGAIITPLKPDVIRLKLILKIALLSYGGHSNIARIFINKSDEVS